MATASKKLAAQQRLSTAAKSDKGQADQIKAAQTAQQETAVPKTGDKPKAELTQKTKVKGASIRGLIQSRLAEGKSTDEISEELQTAFPDSMAAKKAKKHIAFYKSRMKKEGKIVPGAEAAPAKVVVSAKKGAAKKVITTGSSAEETEDDS